jgi:hypothetical protein
MTRHDPSYDLLQEREDRFDETVDDATHSVMTHFDWLDLPDGDELSDLMVRVNDALTALFQEYKPDV